MDEPRARIARTIEGLGHWNTLILPLIEILWIKERGDSEVHDGQSEVCLKEAPPIRIRYKVHGIPQRVNLWLEYAPSSVHDGFYAKYRHGDFQPPRVVWLVRDEEKAPGEYEVEWDGRDETPDRRLLLAGTYSAKVEGRFGRNRRALDSTELVVWVPRAANFGIHYWKWKKGRRDWHSTKRETEFAASNQESLSDGTAFAPYQTLETTADAAMDAILDSALAYWSGHSSPAYVVFHSKQDVRYRRQERSRLGAWGPVAPPNASVDYQKEGAFRDLFLVVLNGCRPGNELWLVEWLLSEFDPGSTDGIHGDKTRAALRKFQIVHGLKPDDGTKNEQTLDWFGISPEGKSEKTLTREVQRRLKRYDPGKVDGEMSHKTRRALRSYQGDNPDLEVTGEADEATRRELGIGRSGRHRQVPLNIADAMARRGADIAIGFEHKVAFDVAEAWGINLFHSLASGHGVNTAANRARGMADHRHRRELEYNIYTQEGVSPEETLHPARYGKST